MILAVFHVQLKEPLINIRFLARLASIMNEADEFCL
jgi:hypothetical protein